MKLTTKHLEIIHNGIASLDCFHCHILKECQSRGITFCKEVSEWLKEGGNKIK